MINQSSNSLNLSNTFEKGPDKHAAANIGSSELATNSSAIIDQNKSTIDLSNVDT